MSCSVTDPRLAFHATYFDTTSHTTKDYLCLYYHGDSTVELIDKVSGKTFLKRTACPNLTKAQFFLGASVVVFGRVLNLVAYADKVTEQLSEKVSESAFVVVTEALFSRIGDCIDIALQECGFGVCGMEMIQLRQADWAAEGGSASMLPNSFAGKRCLVWHLIRDKALEKAAALPSRFGAPAQVWVSKSKQDVESAAGLINAARHRPAADLAGPSSVVIVKPHILNDKRGGEAIQAILNGSSRITLRCLSQVTMSAANADAYLQPYKGILKDYRPTVEHVASGACWVAQFVAADGSDDVVQIVRDIVGPFDPVIAKVLRPKTLRARMGKDASRNAVHCSDLPQDGPVDASAFW